MFWLNEPSILFKHSEITKLWPNVNMSSSEKLNAISRLVIILTLLGYLITRTLKIIVTGVVTLGAIILLFEIQKKYNLDEEKKTINKEGFTAQINNDKRKKQPPNANIKLNKKDLQFFQTPTPINPIMNVLLNQIADEPNRKPAAHAFDPIIENNINKETQQFVNNNFDNNQNIKDKLFQDLGDSFMFDQSMRTWYATPNTQVPNNQEAFADFCYGDMISCKEGNKQACMQNTPPRRIDGYN